MDAIFKEGYILNVFLYASVFLLAQFAVYRLIFAAVIGRPRSLSWNDLKYWQRKVNFLSAVIFAPLFEEVMFTYLAYNSFLQYAQPGKAGIVLLFVASFFALLHLPGDIRNQMNNRGELNYYILFKFQVHRFFYSLAAFFIYQQTQSLWITIFLHYFYNAIVSIFHFDVEDQQFHITGRDAYILLIVFMNCGFAILATYCYYIFSPQLVLLIFLLLGFVLLDYLGRYVYA